MTSVLSAYNAPNPSPLSITQDRLEAATICCSIFEQVVVPDLCRGHERADLKLTSSERLRITNVFFVAWRIILATQSNDLPITQDNVIGLSPTECLHVREVALFTLRNVEDTQQYRIRNLMGYTASGDIREKWEDILRVTNAYFEGKGMHIHQPDYAPLGLGLLFDDWQESYVDTQAEDYHKLISYWNGRNR
jgi:hypothetical protein